MSLAPATAEPGSPFEPLAVDATAAAPRATIHADADLGWFRRLWPVLHVRRGRFFGALALAVVAMVFGMVLPRVTMAAIDRALDQRRAPLAPYLWALAGLGVARAVLTYLYRSVLYRVAYDLEYDLRSLLYGHLLRLDFGFYDTVQGGQLISRANSDIRSVQMFTTFAPLLVLQLASFGVAVALMLSIHVGLTLVSLATLPFTYVATMRLRDITFPLSWIVQARAAEVTTVVDESIQGARVVKGFAAEQHQLDALARSALRLRWANVVQADARARWGPLVENLPRVGLAAVLLYGGSLAIDGRVTVGALVAFNTYVVLLQAPFRFLSTVLMLGQRARASAQRIFEVLDSGATVTDRPGAVDLVDARGAVEFEDVRFGYRGGTPVLDGFSMRIEPGEVVALVGATGSGKSTVARLLDRFYDVDAGSVRVDGHDVRDLTQTSLRHHVALVTDEPFLFSDSVRANIAFTRPDAADADVRAAAVVADADGFVEALADGYDTVVGERGYDLSGGQRQRLALARALARHPRLLLLDDATSAVDPRVEAQILEGLRSAGQDTTVVVVAYRMATISLADEVVHLEHGRVAARGTHAHLLATSEGYRSLVTAYERDAAERAELRATRAQEVSR